MHYIDVSAAVHSRAGLGRYCAALATALIEDEPQRYGLFYRRGGSDRLPPALAVVAARHAVPQRTVRLGYKPWRLAVLLGQMTAVPFDRLLPGASLFHATEHLLPPLNAKATVLTVHDLIYKLFPAYHKRLNAWFLNRAMPLFCRRAGAIIAVSKATKRDIVEHYGVAPQKIHVVYEAAAAHFRPPDPALIEQVRRTYGLPDRYLIHLSTIEPRKNVERLLEALAALRHEWPDLHLVLAGARGWLVDELFRQLETTGLRGIVHALGWVPDEDLPAVIAGAALAVQPTLYEGFGLPLLEHMACGQVVAASNSSSLPEVGGQAAAYFTPTDAADITDVVGRLLRDPEEYVHRRQLGLVQARRFSWQRVARETRAVYDQVI